ncbi:MAG: SIS domain-containing protein [Bacteroidota bacterium]
MKAYIKELLKKEADAINSIPVEDSFSLAIDLIFNRVHTLNGKLVASGMGKAGQIAINIATTFSSTGTPAVFLHPSDAQHGDLGVLKPNDILLLISNSGKNREITELYHLAKNLHDNIAVILITGNPDGSLAKLADVTIYTGQPEEICILGLTPTTSTTTMTVIGDVLVVLLEKKIGFTHEEYAKRHHGGYLGMKSRVAAGIETKKE